MNQASVLTGPVEDALVRAFLLNHPKDAARRLETMPPREAAELLADQPSYVFLPAWTRLPPGVTDNILSFLPKEKAAELLSNLDPSASCALLSRLDEAGRESFFQHLDESIVEELKEILAYPQDSAGALMETKISAFNEHMTVAQAIAQLKNQKINDLSHLYLLSDDLYLKSQVPVQRLALAENDEILASLSKPIKAYVSALDPKNEVMEKIEEHRLDLIPVVDGNNQFVGVIHSQRVMVDLKGTLATEMLTMVGASKEERALSSSWFAVKKRLPWLQINLITAFLAAAVVGMFEETIAKYTALAILLPIAAGQSGNTGAQSLAVTMRGLTLREITVRHWFRVLKKEAGAAIINGIATAITCGTGVYFWSGSEGLALIIALAMISSMTIAAVAGALVPIILKRLGQDPALSSSIILTTVTDIAGFMSFLGIATALSGMLVAT